MGWKMRPFSCTRHGNEQLAERVESSELAEDDGDDEKDENGDDGDGDYPVRSHPAMLLDPVLDTMARGEGKAQYLRAIPLSVFTLLST